MKIFSAEQIRQWDAYTIKHKPISPIDLMERAAEECFIWLLQNFNFSNHFILFCGTGNNGGDGLALARKLYHAKKSVKIFILAGKKRSDDFIINLERLAAENIIYHFITNQDEVPSIEQESVLIDALFGTGLNRPLEGLPEQLIRHINRSGNTIISIDIPSGLFVDKTSCGNTIITATHTLSFQLYKLAFLLPENGNYVGNLHLFNIGLDQIFYKKNSASFFVIDGELVKSICKPRKNFTHKYDYGSALMYTGSKNMMGAAILSTKACLRSGAGLVTVHVGGNTASVIHTAIPEVMTTQENSFEKATRKKNAIAIGPGLEATDDNIELLKKIITHFDQPLVIDATALGLLSQFPELLIQRKQNPAVLTPHTGEFEKLFGKTSNDFERIELALQKASELGCYIILKGHYTFIAAPGGKGYFNINGNPGMATAGSGDVLTGMLTGLLAQGYTQEEACLLGVYLHGLAGDIAAEKLSEEAMIAGDIIDCFGEAFKKIRQ
jgi:hydroxyethylthiazole kinase-like uncharacterized protein yjeF